MTKNIDLIAGKKIDKSIHRPINKIMPNTKSPNFRTSNRVHPCHHTLSPKNGQPASPAKESCWRRAKKNTYPPPGEGTRTRSLTVIPRNIFFHTLPESNNPVHKLAHQIACTPLGSGAHKERNARAPVRTRSNRTGECARRNRQQTKRMYIIP